MFMEKENFFTDTGTAESRAELEKAMLEEQGEQHAILREYMSTQTLENEANRRRQGNG